MKKNYYFDNEAVTIAVIVFSIGLIVTEILY